MLDIDPDNRDALLRRGQAWFRMREYGRAADDYRELLTRDPEDADARAGWWAARLQAAGYSDDVRSTIRAEVESWLAEGPQRVSRQLAAFHGFDVLHDDARSRSLLLQLLRVDLAGDAREAIAQEVFEAALGEDDQAARRLLVDAFLRRFPESVYRHLLYQYHLTWVARLHPDDFLREAKRLVKNDPANRTLAFTAGLGAIDLQRDLPWGVDLARSALSRLDQIDVREKLPYVTMDRWRRMVEDMRGRYEETLGWGLLLLGRGDEAGQFLERAFARLPRDHRTAYHRGRWLEAMGRDREALAMYRLAVETGARIDDAPVALRRLAVSLGVAPADERELWRIWAHEEGVTTFTDVTVQAGLSGVSGGRVAWGDYDGDHRDDLLVDGHRLFRHDGHSGFVEVTQQAGLAQAGGANGGIWADVNNDGRLDFFAMGTGDSRQAGGSGRVWMNRGDGTFAADDVDWPSGLTHDAPTEGAGWGDFDRDGFVDLYLANYERPSERAIGLGLCTPDHLLRNVKGRGFEDVTQSAGILSDEPMCGRGVAWADYDRDGLPDILVTNYRLDPNFLWRNLGHGRFENVARSAGVEGQEQEGAFGHSIGAEWADVNRDGAPDLFIANLAHPRYIGYSDIGQFLVSDGAPSPRFTDRFDEAGFAFDETMSEPSWGDYDNDGDVDLYLTSIYGGRRSTLYRNDGGRFTDVTWLAGAGVENGWGAAYADYDGDGDLDLAVASGDGLRLLRNDGNAHHWLHVRPVGALSNRSAIGARVTVTAGDLRQTAEVQGGKGTGNQHSLPVEFGLGSWNGPVTVEVRFPSGRTGRMTRVQPDRLLTVTEPSGEKR